MVFVVAGEGLGWLVEVEQGNIVGDLVWLGLGLGFGSSVVGGHLGRVAHSWVDCSGLTSDEYTCGGHGNCWLACGGGWCSCRLSEGC